MNSTIIAEPEERHNQSSSPPQGFPILPFPCMLAGFAGHFLYSFAVFAGFACKNSKTIPLVSAAGAKSAENGKALFISIPSPLPRFAIIVGKVLYSKETDSVFRTSLSHTR